MRKEDNEWSFEMGDYDREAREVEINNVIYRMPDHFAGLTHAILLLVDAINDKGIGWCQMGVLKKLLEFADESNQSYGFPIEDHMEYWIKKYDREVLGVFEEKVDKEIKRGKDGTFL